MLSIGRGVLNPQGAHLAPTASQQLILKGLFTQLNVPEHERTIPKNRFEAQTLIQHTAARCWERREHLHREQMKDIRPSPGQIAELEEIWETLQVPKSRRVIPETKEGARAKLFFYEGEADHRRISHANWRQEKQASPFPVAEPPRPPGR